MAFVIAFFSVVIVLGGWNVLRTTRARRDLVARVLTRLATQQDSLNELGRSVSAFEAGTAAALERLQHPRARTLTSAAVDAWADLQRRARRAGPTGPVPPSRSTFASAMRWEMATRASAWQLLRGAPAELRHILDPAATTGRREARTIAPAAVGPTGTVRKGSVPAPAHAPGERRPEHHGLPDFNRDQPAPLRAAPVVRFRRRLPPVSMTTWWPVAGGLH